MTIGIIGGGIAGLASAIALAKGGHQVELFERSDKFQEVGAGLQIGPNAVSALKALGAFNKVEPASFSPANIQIMDAVTGKRLSTLPLGKKFENHFGQPYRVIHRADLLAGLIATARTFSNLQLNLGKTLKRLEINDEANLCHFTDNKTREFKTLIGADGFRSIVRRSVLNDGPPIFAGHSLYRALVDKNQFQGVANINDVHLWLYPGGHVVHYPVSGGNKLNIVAAIEQNWEQQGWNTPSDFATGKKFFLGANEDLQKIINIPTNWLKWAAAGHPFSPTWHTGNTVLVGDAVHPTLPYLAQGAAMALEDAVCLARIMAKNQPIAEFVKQRQPRTKKIVTTSSRLAKIYHMKNPARIARNLVISRTSTNQQFKQLEWLYRWQAPAL